MVVQAHDLYEDGDPMTIPQCSDERDNDVDDLVDISDHGCTDENDMLELNGPLKSVQDVAMAWIMTEMGLSISWRDPGCTRASDTDETTLHFPYSML